MLPAGYESYVTNGNELQEGRSWWLVSPISVVSFMAALRQLLPFRAAWRFLESRHLWCRTLGARASDDPATYWLDSNGRGHCL